MARRYITLAGPFQEGTGQMYVRCPACGEVSSLAEARRQAMVCPWCDFHFPWEAAAHLELLSDEGSFRPLPESPVGPLLLGRATLCGRLVALAVADGTVRWDATEVRALITLLEEARLERRPLLWVMAAVQGTEAVSLWPGVHLGLKRLQAAGHPCLALLTGPCYGLPAATVLRADLVLAEPGATLRPDLPEVLRSPRRLLQAGWADAVLSRQEQRAALAHLLDLLGVEGPALPASGWLTPRCSPGGWIRPPFFELHGDRRSGDDAALMGGLGRLGEDGIRLLFLATVPGKGRPSLGHPGAIGAGGWRKATRLLLLAGRFGLPVVTLIGRPTLRPERGQREAELSAALGETVDTLLLHPAPTAAVLLETDDGPAGLALAATDILLTFPEAAASLREKGLDVDEVAAPEALSEVLARCLRELLQTYAVHGPLGRNKLLQRRYVRWARLAARAERPSRCGPMEAGDET